MKNTTQNLIKIAKMFSMDYENPQSMQTLFNVLVNANEQYGANIMIPAVKAISTKCYNILISSLKSHKNYHDLQWLEMYRNAGEMPAISVEEFTAEDLLTIK